MFWQTWKSYYIHIGKWYINNLFLTTFLTTWHGSDFLIFNFSFHTSTYEREREWKRGWWSDKSKRSKERERLRAREKGRLIRERSGSRERSGEQFVFSPSPILFFLLPLSFFFLHLWSVFFVHPLSFFFLHSPSLLFLRFQSYFLMGFVISPLVEQKKYWVYPLQQIRGLRFRFVEMRHFFPFLVNIW